MAVPVPSLPIIKKLWDASDFSLTVTPFLPELKTLPYRILDHYNDLEALKTIYLTTNPLITALAFSLFLAPVFLLISEVNRNYSQVDRMWSILPTIYNAHYCLYAHMTGMNTERVDNLIAASVLWSLRLTFNYWRKGGYGIGHEDYRWSIIRSKVNAPLFFIFNVTFISTIQSLLLFLITTPTYVLILSTFVTTAETMSRADYGFVRIIGLLVVVAWFADQSQWKFQNAKTFYLKHAKAPFGYNAEDLDRGFVTSGLWSYSRHPNFAAEQAVWVVLYQWGCWDTNVMYNWTFAGAFGYLLLFQGSTLFTEWITAQKYEGYKEYQRRVGKFLPRVKEVFYPEVAVAEEDVEVVEKKVEVEKKEVGGKKKAGIKRDAPRR